MTTFFLEEAPPASGGGLASLLPMILMIAVLGGIVWFSSRKSKKQQIEINNMLDNLEPGDEVTLKCGMIGEIVSIREETITIVTSKDKTKVRFLKSAVMTVDVKAADKRAAAIRPDAKPEQN